MAAVNLQRDAGIMLSNLQILSQFVTSLHRMSTEMMTLGMGSVVLPSEEVAALSMTPRGGGGGCSRGPAVLCGCSGDTVCTVV